MLLSLLIVPIIGVFIISLGISYDIKGFNAEQVKKIALITSIINLLLSLMIFILFDFSSNLFQFVQEYHEISNYDLYLGIDGLSIYFVLLTTMIMPIVLLSNWKSIGENIRSYVIIILLLETLLLAVFLVLDILLFYIFFESILPPLFLLIGIYGSSNKVRASFYLFLYTLFGSLFLLLSILTMSSIMGITDFDGLYKTNFNYSTQLLLFIGIFFAFAVKTPTIFLNSWLLKAHVESPLGGSIILAGIVLKLSLYGIFRLILPLLPKVSLDYTYIVYLIGVITIIYASFSTLRTIDIKELIAYSSVCHAAVYLIGVFSNTIQGIEGGIALGLAHGFVSSGLFICAGGVLYDRSSTRLITRYRGTAQIMPIFSILFFILCLGNAGTPLTLNFVGEFMSLYGTFERLPFLGALACSSIVFSAAYTMFMFNRIAFGGSFSRYFEINISDLNKREFLILFILVVLTVVLGIYPAPILDGLHYSVSSLIYSSPNVSVLFMPTIACYSWGSGCNTPEEEEEEPKKSGNKGKDYTDLDFLEPRGWGQKFYDKYISGKPWEVLKDFFMGAKENLQEEHEDLLEDISSRDLEEKDIKNLEEELEKELKEKKRALGKFKYRCENITVLTEILKKKQEEDPDNKVWVKKDYYGQQNKSALKYLQDVFGLSPLKTGDSFRLGLTRSASLSVKSKENSGALNTSDSKKESPMDYVVGKMETEMPSYTDPED